MRGKQWNYPDMELKGEVRDKKLWIKELFSKILRKWSSNYLYWRRKTYDYHY
jgi:hypothetical protein